MSLDVNQIAQKIRDDFNNGNAKLPVLPKAVIEVQSIVADEEKGANDIAKAISDDATFSATVLRIANSKQFKSGEYEICSLPMAIQRLGGRRTLELLIAISSKLHIPIKNKVLQNISKQVNEHSLMVAAAAQHLARLIKSAEPEEAFLAGVLHDIGVQAVICAAHDELSALPEEACLSVIQQLHREMGGRLLSLWNMPSMFATAASHHGIEADDRPRDKLIDYIDAADFLVQSTGHKVLFDSIADASEVRHFPPMQRLGATETHLAAVEVELEDDLQALKSAFGT